MTRPTDIAGLRDLHQAHHKCSLAECDHYVDWQGCAEMGGLLDELDDMQRKLTERFDDAVETGYVWFERARAAKAKVAELEREVAYWRAVNTHAFGQASTDAHLREVNK